MKITSEWLREKKACNLDNAEEMAYVDSVEDVYIILEKLKSMERYEDAFWLLTRLFKNKMTCVKFAYFSSKSVFHIFENEYPDDNRPRKALDAVEAWIKNPTKENQEKCKIAADAVDAADAAFVAYDAFALYAVYAFYDADSADSAYDAAAYAAAVAADGEEIKEKIYQYGLKLLKEET